MTPATPSFVVPWAPVPMSWLQERYTRAVEKEIPDDADHGPESVFDVDVGVRLSVARTSDGIEVIAVVRGGGDVDRVLRKYPPAVRARVFLLVVSQLYDDLAGKRAVPLTPFLVGPDVCCLTETESG